MAVGTNLLTWGSWVPKGRLTHQPSCAHQLQEENERLHATLSQDQKKAAAQSQRHINALRAQLQEQARLIASQEETVGPSLPSSGPAPSGPLFCEDGLRSFWVDADGVIRLLKGREGGYGVKRLHPSPSRLGQYVRQGGGGK